MRNAGPVDPATHTSRHEQFFRLRPLMGRGAVDLNGRISFFPPLWLRVLATFFQPPLMLRDCIIRLPRRIETESDRHSVCFSFDPPLLSEHTYGHHTSKAH